MPLNVLRFEPLTLLSLKALRSDHPDGMEQKLAVLFNAFGRQFDIQLEPNDLFSPDAENLWIGHGGTKREAPQKIFYKGEVKGESGSWVRFSLRDGVLDGMIRTKDEIYFVEPGNRFFAGSAPHEMVVYRLSDTLSDWGPGTCALDYPAVKFQMERYSQDHQPTAEYQALMAELQALLASTGTLRQIDLGIVADHEYFLAHGASSATAMQNIINQVDGIYRSEVGVALRVTKTVVFSTPADPFTSADPFGLLCEFSAYKTNTNDIKSTGLSHLFTGRNITDAAGIAWLGVVCNDPFTRPLQCPNLPSGNYLLSTGLSEQISTNNNIRVIITAHEIGHNFGAPHDNESGSPCASTPFGFIMNPVSTPDTKLEFSQCSEGFITQKAASASCMVNLFAGAGDPIGVFRPSQGHWFLDTDLNGATNLSVPFGVNGDIPVPADYNGDGTTDLAVFRPSFGRWYLDTDRNGSSNFSIAYGLNGDIPVPADYNGDGIVDLAVFRPSQGLWYIDTDRNGITNLSIRYGTTSDIPLRANGWVVQALGILP